MDNNYKQTKLMEEIILLHKIDLMNNNIEQILRSCCFTIVSIVKAMNPYIGMRMQQEFDGEWKSFRDETDSLSSDGADAIDGTLEYNRSYAECVELLHTSLCTIVQNEIDAGGLLR